MAQRFRTIRKEHLEACCPDVLADVIVSGTVEHAWLEKVIAEKSEWMYAFNETYAHKDLDPDVYIVAIVAGVEAPNKIERYVSSLTNDSWKQDEKTMGFAPAMEYMDQLEETLEAKDPDRLYCGITATDYIGDGISRLSYVFRTMTSGFVHDDSQFDWTGQDSV